MFFGIYFTSQIILSRIFFRDFTIETVCSYSFFLEFAFGSCKKMSSQNHPNTFNQVVSETHWAIVFYVNNIYIRAQILRSFVRGWFGFVQTRLIATRSSHCGDGPHKIIQQSGRLLYDFNLLLKFCYLLLYSTLTLDTEKKFWFCNSLIISHHMKNAM